MSSFTDDLIINDLINDLSDQECQEVMDDIAFSSYEGSEQQLYDHGYFQEP